MPLLQQLSNTRRRELFFETHYCWHRLPYGRGSEKGVLALALSLAFVKLLRQIILQAHFTDCVQLALQIIDMLFLVFEDLLKQGARRVVAHLDGLLDR